MYTLIKLRFVKHSIPDLVKFECTVVYAQQMKVLK